MGWSSLSFPFGSLLTAAQMTQVYSNFASVLAQESGSPDPSGVWSFAAASVIDAPGSHHFGWAKVDSGVAAGGVSSFDTLAVNSGISAPQVSSFGAINVASMTGPGVPNPGPSAWSRVAADGSILQGSTLAGSLRAAGLYTMTFSTPRTTANYGAFVTVHDRPGRASPLTWTVYSATTNFFLIAIQPAAGGALTPDSGFSVLVMGA